jgi:hypothetical protein
MVGGDPGARGRPEVVHSVQHAENDEAEARDARLDEALAMTFPASDPVALSLSEYRPRAVPKGTENEPDVAARAPRRKRR